MVQTPKNKQVPSSPIVQPLLGDNDERVERRRIRLVACVAPSPPVKVVP